MKTKFSDYIGWKYGKIVWKIMFWSYVEPLNNGRYKSPQRKRRRGGKRESPRALRGRSEKRRQMLDDVPEAFSSLQCVIPHIKQRARENTTMTGPNKKHSEAQLSHQWSAWIYVNVVWNWKHICMATNTSHLYNHGHWMWFRLQEIITFMLDSSRNFSRCC